VVSQDVPARSIVSLESAPVALVCPVAPSRVCRLRRRSIIETLDLAALVFHILSHSQHIRRRLTSQISLCTEPTRRHTLGKRALPAMGTFGCRDGLPSSTNGEETLVIVGSQHRSSTRLVRIVHHSCCSIELLNHHLLLQLRISLIHSALRDSHSVTLVFIVTLSTREWCKAVLVERRVAVLVEAFSDGDFVAFSSLYRLVHYRCLSANRPNLLSCRSKFHVIWCNLIAFPDSAIMCVRSVKLLGYVARYT